MADEIVTDPDLLAQLNGSAPAQDTTASKKEEDNIVTDPALLEQLNKPVVTDPALLSQLNAQGPVAPDGSSILGAVAPAVTGYGYANPTGLAELGQKVAQAGTPLYEAAKQGLAGYAKSPGKAIVDIGAAHLGLPPPYATMGTGQTLYNTFKGVAETGKNLAEAMATLPAGTDKVAEPFVKALRPNDFAKFSELVNTQGLEKAFKTFQAPSYLGEEAVNSLNAVKSAFPGTLAKVGQVAGPLLRGAARIAGPAGLAMNAYDAAQFAREADLGGRLARGEGKLAPQAYRGLLNQNVSGYQLTPQEASNLLQSGDERTINIYGGRQKLDDIITSAVRAKAANKILGPVAPSIQ